MFSVNTYKYGVTVKDLRGKHSPLMRLLKKFTPPADFEWDWESLSRNPGISWKFIQEHKDYPWEWSLIIENSCITQEILLSGQISDWKSSGTKTQEILLSDYIPEWKSSVSANPNITWDFVVSHPEIPWDYELLSANPNITWKIVKENPGCDWSKYVLAENPSVITWETVPEQSIAYFKAFSRNTNLTWEIVRTNPDVPWCWYGLSSNPSVATPEVLKNNPKYWGKWRLHCISSNPNFTGHFLETVIYKNKLKGYWKQFYCQNPNLTFAEIEQDWGFYLEQFHELYMNKFLHDPVMYKKTVGNKRRLRKYAVENL